MGFRLGLGFGLTFAIVAVPLLGLSPALAQSGRFQIEPSGPNILRLDRETGEIATCAAGEDGAWRCETLVEATASDAPESALRAENARLEARIEVLERRLARITRIANGGADDAASATAPNSRIDTAKARRDIDDAVEVTGYAFRQFRGLVEALMSDKP